MRQGDGSFIELLNSAVITRLTILVLKRSHCNFSLAFDVLWTDFFFLSGYRGDLYNYVIMLMIHKRRRAAAAAAGPPVSTVPRGSCSHMPHSLSPQELQNPAFKINHSLSLCRIFLSNFYHIRNYFALLTQPGGRGSRNILSILYYVYIDRHQE